jgi:hypothetical protein
MDRDPASILDIVLACRRLSRFVSGRTRPDSTDERTVSTPARTTL